MSLREVPKIPESGDNQKTASAAPLGSITFLY